jgi:hypothetical protein
MTLEQPHTYMVAPAGAVEAAAVLREATALAREGVKMRVGVLESPYLSYGQQDQEAQPGVDTTPRSNAPRAGVSGPVPGKASCLPPEISSEGGTILLSHDRMRDVIEVSKPDLLAVVQGGVRYGELAAAAAREGLRFPHMPETDMTIAEMVMDGTIFPTEGAFGSLREYILSLELVIPTGEIVRFGSRAIKDVGGYELIGFLLGQGGKCGFISSVTLRLLPEPCCRAFVAGTGEVRTLKTLAHNARREVRLSSMVIYEGEAAALVAGMWRDVLGGRGITLPPVLEVDGKALLIGEMQGLEHVVEDQLLTLAGTDALSGASLALLDEELFEISKRFLPVAVEMFDKQGSVVHVSYDGGAQVTPPTGSFLYRSLYPERINAIVPIGKGGAAARPMETIAADPPLRRFLAELAGTPRRGRVYLIERAGETISRIRMKDEDLLDLAGGDDAGERLERAKALDDLNDKVFGAFDPESIMLP